MSRPFHWINEASPEKRVQAMKAICGYQLLQVGAFVGLVIGGLYALKQLMDENSQLAETTMADAAIIKNLTAENTDLQYKLGILDRTNRQMTDDMYKSGVYPLQDQS